MNILKENRFNFLMNNADVKYIRDNLFIYKIEEIICKRKINSKNPQSKTKELIIMNPIIYFYKIIYIISIFSVSICLRILNLLSNNSNLFLRNSLIHKQYSTLKLSPKIIHSII